MATSIASHYVVRWLDSNGVPAERSLPQGSLTIGRASTCDVILDQPQVSREHVRIDVDGDTVLLHDLNSRNGTLVNGEMVTDAHLTIGDEIRIGPLVLEFRTTDLDMDKTVLDKTVLDKTVLDKTVLDKTQLTAVDIEGATLVGQPPPTLVPTPHVPGTVPQEMLNRPIVSESALAAAGIEVKVAEYAALGGGMGSFVFVDLLRNSGVAASDILVVGNEIHPHGHYQRLVNNSQIPPHERIRSNSESCPDNTWGFPGYAVREAWTELTQGHVRTAVSVLLQNFSEPVFAATYTPRVAQVFPALEREAERIGWQQMVRRGRIRAIRKTEEGRILAIVSESDERHRRHFAVSARFLQLAVGYPAIQLLPDLAEYRANTGDLAHVVSAYERHDHIYTHLRQNGGTVLIRGRGIVASRVVQRLWEERQHNQRIFIVHLHRSRVTRGHRFGLSRRVVEEQWEFQPFNWPKSCWGGEYQLKLERSSNEERKRLLDLWEGTTTASRPDWRRIIREGIRDGWYRTEFGAVHDVRLDQNGRVVTHIDSHLAGGGTLELTSDFVIDCTGLVASPEYAPFLADFLDTYDLPRNPKGRLQVTNDFEIAEMRHGEARLFAAGALTLGGPHAGVDTFLGLQYSALAAVRAMQRYRPKPKGLRRLWGPYAIWQWLKWARGRVP